MGIEYITADLVRINGYFVEIRDSREPDFFDRQFEQDNAAALAELEHGPIRDSETELLRTVPAGISVDPIFMAYQQIPRFIDLARKAATQRAVSWRGFNVGASAFALDSYQLRVGYLFGANYKPTSDATDKYCAEFDVITKARQRDFERIVALAIFGPNDNAEVNEVDTPTLHPCEQCRTLLETDPLVPDDTLIITADAAGNIELMMVPDLLDVHRK